ncbi:uncharacterized protein LOC143367462 [Andrena cerasifolii]|uniref:uncharacterized protein LOC143367462 n=1 Tax=Andrena cerasifolii TaxID=2819439 RepID=UPI0040376C55
MVTDSTKTLALVISAIKNLREQKGSSSQEILHYLSSVYDVPQNVARRQMQTALKRGVAYGILKKNGSHYVLPIISEAKGQEIASQELSLLDYCRRKCMQQKLSVCCKCKKPKRMRRRRKKTMCKSKRRSRRRSRRMKKCRCKSRRRRSRRRSRRTSRRKRKCTCGGLGPCAVHKGTEPNDKAENEQLFKPEVGAKESVASECSSAASTFSTATS